MSAAEKIICLQNKLHKHIYQLLGAFWPRAAAAFTHLTAERLVEGGCSGAEVAGLDGSGLRCRIGVAIPVGKGCIGTMGT